MTNVWREQLIQDRDLSKETKLMRCIKTRLKDISSQIIVSTLEGNQGKLIFMKTSKKGHNVESYLHINNFENRRVIAKLRTSSRNLAIETGTTNL